MDTEMADVKSSHIKQDDLVEHQSPADYEQGEHVDQSEHNEQNEHIDHIEHEQGEHHEEAMDDAQDAHQYEQQYDQGYVQQYEGDVTMYEEQGEGEYAGEGGLAYVAAADAASAVASAIATADGQQEYGADAGQYAEQGEAEQEYEQQEAYIDDPNAQYAEPDGETGLDEQTLASHPATTREMEVAESMVVDAEHGMSSDVAHAMNRYGYENSPDGLQTLAATSSAVTQHASMETPSKQRMHQVRSPMYSDQKQMMPKFNRARNWSTDETKIMLAELERIVTNNPEERRENVLRSHATFEEIAEVLRDKGYSNRDGQGCMIRWRNLLRVYKNTRASVAEGKSPGHPQNLQYASAIEAIYRFPPDGIHFSVSETSPGIDSTPTGSGRTWSQANGYETPARKRTREISAISEHLEHIDSKIDQTMDYMLQHNDLLRTLEDRLIRAEDALKQSEATIADLHTTISEKDAKREELQNQLMVTVQALSQVIATKKGEEPQ
ncbi:hypothetical protein LPJ77_000071 [Coemansia sp. RSA 2523]|nr:hypothetical protein LPJ58_001693 [Coemansia sp. RSA 1591]KAJ1777857.1 hypothetical protein LPJ54_002115 [Coemansia sp. RSA 1824]KAJ1790202.1 hypothetical protein LPJ62_002044 [Coemansia sp. RSA 2167]KAJ1792451.1 hypothetical protein LPJ67_001549 [Coemansia sp. RSA 1938]KAJ1811457.1 hypothetical protein LPJ77_000071 [Coemansia sp. RSA 2523]KAJ2139595.1 hypothetical protein GGH17_000381 [Coemansia sp. RSA 788]KAJ2149089.1 hypothetical protein IW142_000371 [Coemansia sp. RSA 564]KAJ2155564.